MSCSFCRGQDGSLPASSCPFLCPSSLPPLRLSLFFLLHVIVPSVIPLTSLCSSRIFSILLEKPEGNGPWLKLSGVLYRVCFPTLSFYLLSPSHTPGLGTQKYSYLPAVTEHLFQ